MVNSEKKQRKINKKSQKESYYDGHYMDSGLSPEEREKRASEAMRQDEELTDWPEDPEE